MATKKYNPYNSAKKIVDLKGYYDDAKLTNGNYQQYQNEAAQYYNDLVANGYVEAAETLAKSGYKDALSYLNESGYKPDEEFELDNWIENIGKVSTGDKSPISEQQFSYIDKLMGIGTGETSPKTSDAVSQMMNQWFADNQTYIDQSGELHNAGMSGLDSLLNYDYTKQSFYQPIMESYNLYGDNAANGQLASGAAANAGNIDSYAAANAARQQLAFTNAGHQAALAAAAQNQGSYLDLFGKMGDNNSDLRLNNATTLTALNNMYSTDSNERQAANDVIRQLFGDESVERQNATNATVDKYLADLGLVQTKYTTDAQERMNTENVGLEKYLGDLGYSSDLANYAAQERMNAADNNASYERLMAEIAGDKELAGINNEAALRELQNRLLSEERINTANNQNAIKVQEMANQNALAVADRENLYNSANSAVEANDKSQIKAYVEEAIAAMEEGDDVIKTYNAVLKYADSFDKQNFGGKYSDYIRELVDEHKKYGLDD